MPRRLTLAAAVALLAGASLASAQTAQRLRAIAIAPLTVRAVGFEARDTVRATLTRGRLRVVRTARTDGPGAFSVRFPLLVAVEPCRELTVRAVGGRGGTALYVHRCRPADPAG
jgi:hypothetical protein